MEMNRGASPFSKGAAPRPLFASFPPRRAARDNREKCAALLKSTNLVRCFTNAQKLCYNIWTAPQESDIKILRR